MHEPCHLLPTIPLLVRAGEPKSPNSRHTRQQNSPGPARMNGRQRQQDRQTPCRHWHHKTLTRMMGDRERVQTRPGCYHLPPSHPHVPPKGISALCSPISSPTLPVLKLNISCSITSPRRTPFAPFPLNILSRCMAGPSRG